MHSAVFFVHMLILCNLSSSPLGVVCFDGITDKVKGLVSSHMKAE